MVKVVSNFLKVKQTMKEFEKALSSGDKEELLKIGTILMISADDLALEVLCYSHKPE